MRCQLNKENCAQKEAENLLLCVADSSPPGRANIPRDQSVVEFANEQDYSRALLEEQQKDGRGGKRTPFPAGIREQHSGQLMRINKRSHDALAAVGTPEADESRATEDAKHCAKCLASSNSLLGWVDPAGDACAMIFCRSVQENVQYCRDCLENHTRPGWCPEHTPVC